MPMITEAENAMYEDELAGVSLLHRLCMHSLLLRVMHKLRSVASFSTNIPAMHLADAELQLYGIWQP